MKNYQPDIDILKDNLNELEGEIFLFSKRGVKKSARSCRNILMNIIKISKQMRIDVMEDYKKLPVSKRNISKSAIKKSQVKRKVTMESRKKWKKST